MRIPFESIIDGDVIEKFKLALMLNKEETDEVIEKLMMQYISNSFSRVSQEYRPTNTLKVTGKNKPMDMDTGKAINRIPRWAMKPDQNNHKIVRAFFQLENGTGLVLLDELEKRCSDYNTYPSTYVRDFRGNFNQMKFDAPKSHGKVFEVKNGNVEIWDYVKETLMEYKDYFCE